MNEINSNDPKIQRIINAALKEFSLRGYDEASTNRIAKAAGISKALMFHYVKSKEDLFLFLLDYCNQVIEEKYLSQLDYQENDLFNRLQQSYTLQIELMKKHPWIFDFTRLEFEVPPEKMEKNEACTIDLFDAIDDSKFRTELSVERCKQLILWGNIGFTEEILSELKQSDYQQIDLQAINTKLTQYLDDLRTVFYGE